MLQYSNTNQTTGAPIAVARNPYTVNGATGTQVCIFMPTAMDLDTNTGGNTVANQAIRTATTCYIKGFAEKLRIQTSSQLPWFWRRIVFRAKNSQFYAYSTADTPISTIGPAYVEVTTSGMQRLWMNQTINGANQTLANIEGVLFKGAFTVDWDDRLTAQIDTRRVDLMSDRTTTIRSGNAAGGLKSVKHYIPYNHNLVYDDDETGKEEVSRYNSVNDKQGNGDLLIYDIFQPGAGATTADLLQVVGTASLYWHEK